MDHSVNNPFKHCICDTIDHSFCHSDTGGVVETDRVIEELVVRVIEGELEV